MMFECIDKIYPSVSIDTVTGSICSFNDEYGGLPLKSCVSQISGYQEGSGIPSPSNVRNLVSFNSATLTENGNTYTFTFGQSIYQGSIDWKRGVAVGTHGYADLGSLNWNKYGTDKFYTTISDIKLPTTIDERNQGIWCSIYKPSTGYSLVDMSDKSFLKFNQDENFWIYDSDYTDATAFETAMNGVYLAYELATPITIPLGGINLLTQEGVNNIFCDTGDTTVEYIKIV